MQIFLCFLSKYFSFWIFFVLLAVHPFFLFFFQMLVKNADLDKKQQIAKNLFSELY